MKYSARELMQGLDNTDAYRDIEMRDCGNVFEAKNFVDYIVEKGYELQMKRQKKDYDKVVLVELYFEKKKTA